MYFSHHVMLHIRVHLLKMNYLSSQLYSKEKLYFTVDTPSNPKNTNGFLYFSSSVLQDMPLHVSTMSFLLLAWDRFRFIKDPLKPRLPAFVCIVGSWLTALCLVLPYPIYIIYIDLSVSIQNDWKYI